MYICVCVYIHKSTHSVSRFHFNRTENDFESEENAEMPKEKMQSPMYEIHLQHIYIQYKKRKKTG